VKYIIPAFLILFAIPAQANPLFQFQTLQKSIECIKKTGQDYVTCTYKTEEAEIEARIEENLIPYVELQAQSVDADFDYVWSHIQSYDITLDIEPTFQECNLTGWTDNPYEDIQYSIDLRDLNDDEYDDYLVVALCHSDIYYKGKTVSREYGANHWTETFLAMFCGSEQGLYNCTEELTGHENVVNVAGDILPGKMGSPKAITLFDFNGDGIKDAIIPQNRDYGKGINFHLGSEWFDAYFELMGMTRQEVIDTCRLQSGDTNSPDDDTCWVMMAQHTYAISGPDGKWEIKTLDLPQIWSGDGIVELYLKDGEYHVNIRGANAVGFTNWHVFNPDTNSFDFVAYGHKREPWDISENWNQYEIFADNTPWKKIGDKEYRIETNDESLGKGGVPGTHCGDWWDRNYAECQFDQLHILSKDESGNVTKVMEYNVEDWIDDKRKVRVQNVGGVNVNSDLSNWSDFASVSYNLHGNWVNVTMGGVILADIRQLETRADAPWYLIVSVEGRNDLRNPGKKFVSEIDYECQPQSMDDEPCLQNASAIVFKYLIDFESNTLTYAGTLLEEEYPFMWIGLDGAGPATWTWKDQNNDGWYDIIVSASDHHHPFVSDDQGTYRYLDRFQVHPIMAYGRNFNHDDKLYDADTYEYIDVTGDGITDFMGVISGSSLTQVLDRWFPGHDPRLNDLYQPDRIYLDIVHGAYDMFTEANVVDYIEVQERMSECIDRAVNTSFTLFEAHRCYNMPWIF